VYRISGGNSAVSRCQWRKATLWKIERGLDQKDAKYDSTS